MNKAELISRIQELTDGSKKDIEATLTALTSVVTEALQNDDDVTLVGIGKFDSIAKTARTGRNPQTGEPVQISARTAPRFKASKQLKDALN